MIHHEDGRVVLDPIPSQITRVSLISRPPARNRMGIACPSWIKDVGIPAWIAWLAYLVLLLTVLSILVMLGLIRSN